jgi:hypothetical protein
MRLSLISIVLFTSTVFADGLADGTAIIAAMNKIINATTALDKVVANFPAGPQGFLDVVSLLLASAIVLSDINSGTIVADASANLTFDEAVQVAGTTGTLVSVTQSSLNSIIAAKPIFDADLLSPLILINLKEEKAASDKFSAAVISKVPAILQSTAESLVAPIDTAFTQAIGDFTGAI